MPFCGSPGQAGQAGRQARMMAVAEHFLEGNEGVWGARNKEAGRQGLC